MKHISRASREGSNILKEAIVENSEATLLKGREENCKTSRLTRVKAQIQFVSLASRRALTTITRVWLWYAGEFSVGSGKVFVHFK